MLIRVQRMPEIVEKEILNGNEEWKVIYHAMALQEAKAIAALAATAKGKVDCIALSGGLSYSEMFVNWIREYVGFIAPIYVFPGEFEMEAMAMSVLNAVEGKHLFTNTQKKLMYRCKTG